MKISNSKKELARIISEHGGWRDGVDGGSKFAAQQDDGEVWFSAKKPEWNTGRGYFSMGYEDHFTIGRLITNRHQAILSRAEYYHIYPAPDADGWIEFDGAERPSGYFNKMIDVKLQDGRELTDSSGRFEWDTDGPSRIIAYRLHNQELAKSEFCESVMRSIPEPETKPTIEQLAADYRNAKDYAERKQQETDAAKADAEEKLKALELGGEALGLLVSPVTAKQEQESVVASWQDLQVGDEIEVFDFDEPDDGNPRKAELMSGVCVVMRTGACVHVELKSNLPKERGDYWNAQGVDKCKFRFIRRP